jgi:murein L,D-transpeptidase YafK
MTKRTWLDVDERDEPIIDDETAADSLWTRRSALALTAGFFAVSGSPGTAGVFRQTLQPRADHVVISKKNRLLVLMQGSTTLRRYRVHLGFAPEGHKTRSGDGRTPEGRYQIDRRNARSEFYLSLGISYPNATDVARARAMGVRPGGDIFIHGGPRPGIDKRDRDWTAGCIAVTNEEIEEIWSVVPTGIPITIIGA